MNNNNNDASPSIAGDSTSSSGNINDDNFMIIKPFVYCGNFMQGSE